MSESEDPVVFDQELLGHGLLGLVEQPDDGTAEYRGEQVGVQFGADHGGGAQQQPGRAELVAPRGYRLHQRRGQFRARGLLGQFGQEQRVALRAGVQLVDPARPDEFSRRVTAEPVEMDGRRRGQRLSLAGPDCGDDRHRYVLAPDETQPVRQRGAGQVRVVEDDRQRRALRQAAERPDQSRVQHRRAEHAIRQRRWHPLGPRARRHVQQRRQYRHVGGQDIGGHPGLELAAAGRRARSAARRAAASGRAARTTRSVPCPRPPRADRPRPAAASSSRCRPRRRPRRSRWSRRGPGCAIASR